MKKLAILMLILTAAFNSLGLYQVTEVNIIPEDNTPQHGKLRILCQHCKQALYECDVDELFYDVQPNPSLCRAVRPGIPEFNRGNELFCPFDRQVPYQMYECTTPPYQCSLLLTNKGWMPRRERPI